MENLTISREVVSADDAVVKSILSSEGSVVTEATLDGGTEVLKVERSYAPREALGRSL